MPKDAHESNKEALRELTRVLEETVTAGADCLELERENQELVVYQYLGSTGVGAVAIPEKLQKAVIKEIVNRASLHRKPTGKFLLTLLGKEYEVFAKEYDSFGCRWRRKWGPVWRGQGASWSRRKYGFLFSVTFIGISTMVDKSRRESGPISNRHRHFGEAAFTLRLSRTRKGGK